MLTLLAVAGVYRIDAAKKIEFEKKKNKQPKAMWFVVRYVWAALWALRLGIWPEWFITFIIKGLPRCCFPRDAKNMEARTL